MGTPYFERYRSWNREYRFTMRAANGEKIAQGEGYKNQEDRDRAIRIINGHNNYPVMDRFP